MIAIVLTSIYAFFSAFGNFAFTVVLFVENEKGFPMSKIFKNRLISAMLAFVLTCQMLLAFGPVTVMAAAYSLVGTLNVTLNVGDEHTVSTNAPGFGSAFGIGGMGAILSQVEGVDGRYDGISAWATETQPIKIKMIAVYGGVFHVWGDIRVSGADPPTPTTNYCTVTVLEPVDSITVTSSANQLEIGQDPLQLTVSYTPTTAYPQPTSYTWTTNNSAVATVNSIGKVTAHGAGTARITAKYGLHTDFYDITVPDPNEVTQVTIEPTTQTIEANTSAFRPVATVHTTGAGTNGNVTWRTSNPDIATVAADGTVTGVSVGVCDIIAASTVNSNITASCRLTVLADSRLAAGVTVSPPTLSLYDGETREASATVQPLTALNRNVVWASSNPDIATVQSSGLAGSVAKAAVTGVAPGECYIYARTVDGNFQALPPVAVTVTLDPAKARSVSLSPASLPLMDGETQTLTATVLPASATNKAVTWASSNPDVATVNANGAVTGITTGTCFITVTTADGGHTAQAPVTVTLDPGKVRSVSVSPATLTLPVGGDAAFSALVLPDTARDKTVTWASDDPSVATIDADGNVTAIGEGLCEITATSNSDGHVGRAALTVLPRATGITVAPTAQTIVKGTTLPLSVSFTPPNAFDQGYTWQPGDPAVATIDPATNLVTAIGNGTTTFTAVADDGGHTATATITVITEADGFDIIEDMLPLPLGESYTLTTVFTPEETTDKTITWHSDNEAVATVDATGTVTAQGVGQAIITGTATDGGYSDFCVVNAYIPVTGVTLSEHSVNLPQYQSMTLTAAIAPSDATHPEVTWHSSNPSIATVDDNGFVYGAEFGTTTITVTTEEGAFTDSCEIRVVTPVDGVYIREQNLVMESYTEQRLHAILVPANATNQDVQWSSSHPDVARVSAVPSSRGMLPTSVPAPSISPNLPPYPATSGSALTVTDPSILPPVATPDASALLNTPTLRDASQPSGPPEALLTAADPGQAVITAVTAVTADGAYTDTTHVRVLMPVSGITLSETGKFLIPGTGFQLRNCK
jgi:uncharacterized protein YjdB